ncbi:NAD-dependent epimerase/dehydratase family protein [Acinetobacter silvestris]|uniref:NAD(P)-dependent oxidoreductase n=1 Tax=Acinetobacter silvestris TaxID=1977882 RepID=A0A1Y3CKS0_9GAMM|nr:NAD-dependent epimerase/dehydratase family protein [Acinetobacter silvestris]OTG67710.1 NAD(P)-dependent oxidoreductase [Acinetobacter silvestris]
MHILFIGYGKTSARIAKQLFQQGHQITTVSRSSKDDDFAQHLIQDIHQLDLSKTQAIDVVYVLLTPSRDTAQSSVDAYQQTYVDSVQPIVNALQQHPVQRIIIVSSTRVYGRNHGECIDDDSEIIPSDEQGQLLLKMEQLWQQAYPCECVIVRPTGIYGTSVARMVKLAETTKTYPNIHWSNRIHIEDLARFLAYLIHVEHFEKSYICSNNRPTALHETIQWFQRYLNLPELVVQSERESGKQIFAKRMLESGFELQHQDYFKDYAALLQ